MRIIFLLFLIELKKIKTSGKKKKILFSLIFKIIIILSVIVLFLSINSIFTKIIDEEQQIIFIIAILIPFILIAFLARIIYYKFPLSTLTNYAYLPIRKKELTKFISFFYHSNSSNFLLLFLSVILVWQLYLLQQSSEKTILLGIFLLLIIIVQSYLSFTLRLFLNFKDYRFLIPLVPLLITAGAYYYYSLNIFFVKDLITTNILLTISILINRIYILRCFRKNLYF